jgi:hypothetical protein
MLAACRLAGLSALILDYGVSGARRQFPNADRPGAVWHVSNRAATRQFSASRRDRWRLRPVKESAPDATERLAGWLLGSRRSGNTTDQQKRLQRSVSADPWS